MRLVKLGLVATGVILAAGVVVFGVFAFTGAAQAQEGPEKRTRHQELLAQKLGVTLSQLEAAQKAARDQLVDEAVAAGRITAEQGARLKAMEPGEGRVAGRAREHAARVVRNVVQTAAEVIGIDVAQVRSGLQSGQSLAQIATTNGMSRDLFKSKLTAALEADIQQALANGTITQAQAEKLKSGLNNIDQIIDHAGVGKRPSGRPGFSR